MSQESKRIWELATQLQQMREGFARAGATARDAKNGFSQFFRIMDEIQYGPRSFTPAEFNRRWKRLSKQSKIDYVLYLIS